MSELVFRGKTPQAWADELIAGKEKREKFMDTFNAASLDEKTEMLRLLIYSNRLPGYGEESIANPNKVNGGIVQPM